jgi:hypothetical protein
MDSLTRTVGQITAPTPAQVREQVAAVRQKVRDARVIGIRADDWTGPEAIEVDGARFRVAMCRSPLEVREELIELNDGGGLIVLTPVSEQDLGGDVLARFAKRRLFDIDTWTIALDLFKARSADPRVQKARWLADALVENAPPGRYDPAPAGVLDADTVWHVLLRLRLGLPDGRPDALALLRWAATPAAVERYVTLSSEFREGVRHRIHETAGTVGLAMLDALEISPASDLVAMGLACRVLFHPSASSELRDAAIRFERFHRQHPLSTETGLQWAEAAERVLVERESELGWAAARTHADRADRLLVELGAEAFLHVGRWSPGGFEQRLGRLASALESSLRDASGLAAVEQAAGYLLDHRLVRLQEARSRRVEMARRLVRWLHQARGPEPASLADAINAYCCEGAFVDLARLALLGGDQPPALGRAYVELLNRARGRREEDNARFGRLLVGAGASPAQGQLATVPVERVLEDVVAPLSRDQPALLLVMDGLSRAVYHDLLDAIADEGWRLWKPDRPELQGTEWAALAAIPTITEISRTSLFCGSLTAGSASDEKRGFSRHPALLHASRSRRPPLLFHKGELFETSGRGLSSDVKTALTTADQKIVGVVLNVVDDLLFKGDQIQPRWTVDSAPLLRELFDAARASGRAIVLTSDHGHLLDDDSAFEGREAGDRWREDEGEPGDGEVRLQGRRVLGPGRSSVIVPWSERTRYGPRKNGYHGGITPQEAVLPLAVLTWGGSAPAGFVEAPLTHPDWWFEPIGAARPRPPLQPVPVSRTRKERPLLDALDPGRGAVAASESSARIWWIEALLVSERYVEQKELSSGRGLPPDDKVRRLLLALGERGGKLTKAALAQRLGLPPFRLTGLIVATRRLLNVDGLQVLEVDESETVSLSRPLLERQFELRER